MFMLKVVREERTMPQILDVSAWEGGRFGGNKIVTAYVRGSVGFEEAEGSTEAYLTFKSPIWMSKQAFYSVCLRLLSRSAVVGSLVFTLIHLLNYDIPRILIGTPRPLLSYMALGWLLVVELSFHHYSKPINFCDTYRIRVITS
jgi:hypothetical protein